MLEAERMTEFFRYLERPRPDFNRTLAVQALKDYIEECGGDPDRKIVHFAPPHPVPPESQPRRQTKASKITRSIGSSRWAMKLSANGYDWVLQSWTDPVTGLTTIGDSNPRPIWIFCWGVQALAD